MLIVEFYEFSDYIDMVVVVEGRNFQRQIFARTRFKLIDIVNNIKKCPALGSGNQCLLAIRVISHFYLLFS